MRSGPPCGADLPSVSHMRLEVRGDHSAWACAGRIPEVHGQGPGVRKLAGTQAGRPVTVACDTELMMQDGIRLHVG